MKIKQLLFDCDNTLVLSEELAFEACGDLANQILERQHITYRYTGSQLMTEFVGQNFRGMLLAIMKKYNFELSEDEIAVYVRQEEGVVITKIEAKALPCIGVNDELEKLYQGNKYGLAVVSSSALRRVRASIAKVGQEKFFPHDHVYSAATSLPKPTSKPDPAVYLYACEQIGVKPEECVAIEDSKSGATAALRAGIPCIAYVGSYEGEEKQRELANILKELGCKNVMWNWNEFEKCLAEIEAT